MSKLLSAGDLTITKTRLLRRPRRLRQNPYIRDLVQETHLSINDLIQPIFIVAGNNIAGHNQPEPIDAMPGVYRFSLKDIINECNELVDLGIKGIAIFPKIDPVLKTSTGIEALNENTLVLQATRLIKEAGLPLLVFSDIALDPYTNHGHDGVISEDGDYVDNDRSVEILAEMAILNARAGADFVAPSDMMDGRVAAIRQALDSEGFENVGILAYSAKFASAYYGPFRDAVGSLNAAGTQHLDKKTYQLNPANRLEAIIETKLDEQEGADMLMVKPAGIYLDIIRELRNNTNLPVAAYQVSGEYSQIHAAAQLGWLDLKRCRDESLLAIKRAGADIILTYFAKSFAKEQLSEM